VKKTSGRAAGETETEMSTVIVEIVIENGEVTEIMREEAVIKKERRSGTEIIIDLNVAEMLTETGSIGKSQDIKVVAEVPAMTKTAVIAVVVITDPVAVHLIEETKAARVPGTGRHTIAETLTVVGAATVDKTEASDSTHLQKMTKKHHSRVS